MKEWRALGILFLACVVVVLASAFGSLVVERLTYHPQEEQTTVVHPETVTVVKTVTVEATRDVMPDSCKRALELDDEVRAAATSFDSASSKQVDIMEAAGKMIAARDQAGLLLLVQKQRDLSTATLTAATRLSVGLAEYNKARLSCEEETK